MAHLDLLKRETVQSQIKARACLESLSPLSTLFCTKMSSRLVPLLPTLRSAQVIASLPVRVSAHNLNCNHIYKLADFVHAIDLSFAQVFRLADIKTNTPEVGMVVLRNCVCSLWTARSSVEQFCVLFRFNFYNSQMLLILKKQNEKYLLYKNYSCLTHPYQFNLHLLSFPFNS